MRRIANLHDASQRGTPCWLRVAPEELPVDDGVVGGCFDEFLEGIGYVGELAR